MAETTFDDSLASSTGTRKLIAFLHTTLDGFIANSDGVFWERFAWGETEMEWNNEQFRQADTWVLGRAMYETIVPWWTTVAAGAAPEDAGEITRADRDFAEMLSKMTKVVASRTLSAREDRQVIADDVPRRLRELKHQPGASVMLSCGPALLSELAQHPDLIDDYLLIVHPAAIGAGVPLFAPLTHEVQLDVVEIKTFDGGAHALRYRPVSG
jgi:dihydrofolate reductase